MGSANLKHCLEKSLDLNPATREFARSLLVGYSSGQRGRTVNPPAYAFDGSNPSPTTTFRYAEGLKIQVTMAKARNVAVRDENLGSTERSGEGSRGAGVRSTWPLRLVNPLSA